MWLNLSFHWLGEPRRRCTRDPLGDMDIHFHRAAGDQFQVLMERFTRQSEKNLSVSVVSTELIYSSYIRPGLVA